MSERFIVDCAGRKIPVGEKHFCAKCWVGNTTDFLTANESFIISPAMKWQSLPKVSITVPIYRSGDDFKETLESLLSQQWRIPEKVEILLYVNQPLGELDDLTQRTLKALGMSPEETTSGKCYKEHHRGKTNASEAPVTRAIFEQLQGGLATVYQRSFVTLVARLRQAVDQMNLSSKEEKVLAIEKLMSDTVFAVVDDDLIFRDKGSFSSKLDSIVAGESVLLGSVNLQKVSSGFTNQDSLVLALMRLFLQVKQSLGTSVLTPRAASVKDLFHLPAPDPAVPYSDQIWFAGAAKDKTKLLVEVETTIKPEGYPSNAEMAARLGEYLEAGHPKSAIDIFKNLQRDYVTTKLGNNLEIQHLTGLISLLEERDTDGMTRILTQTLR